jgi:hypothetical protein
MSPPRSAIRRPEQGGDLNGRNREEEFPNRPNQEYETFNGNLRHRPDLMNLKNDFYYSSR